MRNKLNVIRKHRAESYKSVYLKARRKNILKNNFLIESTHGNSFDGHMLEITKSLNYLGYGKNVIFVVAVDTETIQEKVNSLGIDCTVIQYLGKDYAEKLATCQYLFNDTTFRPFFNKREDQKYFNIWHGTPLKYLGKDLTNPIQVGNVQRNLYSSDKIIVSNQYTANKIVDAFQLDGIYEGKILETFSPRNTVFYDPEISKRVRNELNLSLDDKLFVYMPTWRDTKYGRDQFQRKLIKDLHYLEKELEENEHFYIQLHPLQSDLLDKQNFTKVKTIPRNINLYEFLAGSDALVTDYSSVMYDYLNTDKPIIIYSFDKENYYFSRGCYEDVSKYSFFERHSIDKVLKTLRSVKQTNYIKMKKRFCNYDMEHNNKTTTLLKYLINDQKYSNLKEYSIKNDKETVAIFSGGLMDNGITTALLNMLDEIDLKKRNYILFFDQNLVRREHQYKLKELPNNIKYYPIFGGGEGSFLERFIVRRDALSESKFWNLFKPILARFYQREFERIFGQLKIDHFIHYTGFERKTANLIKYNYDSSINQYMWVHSDTFSDKENRGRTMNLRLILEAQENSKKVVLVNEKLKELYQNNHSKVSEKLIVVDNFLANKKINIKAKEHILSTLFESPIIKGNLRLLNMLKTKYKPNNQLYVTNNLLQHLLWENKQEYIPNIAQNLTYLRSYFEKSLVRNFKGHSKKDLNNIQHMSFNIVEKLGYSKTLLLDDLLNPEIKVFINIGRFSREKSHDRLIKAFASINQAHPNTRLIIVAPHGNLKEETIQWALDSGSSESIYILGRMSNPYNLIKLCDAYVLSSLHEGLGLVVYESLAVETCVITVNIPETVAGLKKDDAIIVENSTIGIEKGMLQFLTRGAPTPNFDFKSWNEASKVQLESIFEFSDT